MATARSLAIGLSLFGVCFLAGLTCLILWLTCVIPSSRVCCKSSNGSGSGCPPQEPCTHTYCKNNGTCVSPFPAPTSPVPGASCGVLPNGLTCQEYLKPVAEGGQGITCGEIKEYGVDNCCFCGCPQNCTSTQKGS